MYKVISYRCTIGNPCEKEVHFIILLKRIGYLLQKYYTLKNILKCELNVMFSDTILHVNCN